VIAAQARTDFHGFPEAFRRGARLLPVQSAQEQNAGAIPRSILGKFVLFQKVNLLVREALLGLFHTDWCQLDSLGDQVENK